MAGVSTRVCSRCDTVLGDADVLCPGCGAHATHTATFSEIEPTEPPGRGGGTEGSGGGTDDAGAVEPACPYCHQPLSSPNNKVCLNCFARLDTPAAGAAGETGTASPQPQPDAEAPATRRESARVELTLAFDGGEHHLDPGASLLLGRDPALSPAGATLAAHDNVSRRHATVGVDADGSAWVTDEHSTNGTHVNGARVPAGGRVPLRDGDTLRLAADVTAHVSLAHGKRT